MFTFACGGGTWFGNTFASEEELEKTCLKNALKQKNGAYNPVLLKAGCDSLRCLDLGMYSDADVGEMIVFRIAAFITAVLGFGLSFNLYHQWRCPTQGA